MTKVRRAITIILHDGVYIGCATNNFKVWLAVCRLNDGHLGVCEVFHSKPLSLTIKMDSATEKLMESLYNEVLNN